MFYSIPEDCHQHKLVKFSHLINTSPRLPVNAPSMYSSVFASCKRIKIELCRRDLGKYNLITIDEKMNENDACYRSKEGYVISREKEFISTIYMEIWYALQINKSGKLFWTWNKLW